MSMLRPLAARRALLHPLWIASLGLLAANDHFFKGSGLLPSIVTGKLSDFAGLVVAPTLLAVLLRLSSRKGLTFAHLATGIVFAAIKVSPTLARLFESIAGLGPFSWSITVDPTDLFALPSLLLSYRVLVPVMEAPAEARPLVQRALVVGGSLACAATSQQNFPTCEDPIACGVVPRENAAIVIANATGAERFVRVRPLKDSAEFDCNTLLADPESALSREIFDDADAWLIQAERGLPLQNDTKGRTCVAYLIDSDGLPPALLAWSTDQFPTVLASTSTATPDPNVTLTLSLDTNGKLGLSPHPALFKAPPVEDPPPAAGCGVEDPGVGVEWSTPVPINGPFVVAGIESSPDGCHGIMIENKPTFYVCVPAAAMPFKAGDVLEIAASPVVGGAFAEAGNEAPVGEKLILRSATDTVVAVRGNMLARYVLSESVEPLTEPTIDGTTVQGCAGAHDICGGLQIPMDISLLGDHVPVATYLRAGQNVKLADGYGTLHIVRAESIPVRDTKCPPFAHSSRHYESVLVLP